MKKIYLFFGFFLFLNGCSCINTNTHMKNPPVKKVKCVKEQPKVVKISTGKTVTFKVIGSGVAPCENMCNMAQAKVMARRAAILNAYELLAEKIYGIEIDGQDNVKNSQVVNTKIFSHVKGVVKGAIIENEEFKDGIYYVTMSIKLNAKDWNNNLTFK